MFSRRRREKNGLLLVFLGTYAVSKGTYAVFRDFEVHTRFGTYAVWEGYIRGMGRYIRGMGKCIRGMGD